MKINYFSHGGIRRVAIVYCPSICSGRLLHLSKDEGEKNKESWKIRDYILDRKIVRLHNLDEELLNNIEERVVWSDDNVPSETIKQIDYWKDHIKNRTNAVGDEPGFNVVYKELKFIPDIDFERYWEKFDAEENGSQE